MNGTREENWATRDADGKFVAWTREMAFLWGAKDDLPARGLVCGWTTGRLQSLVSNRATRPSSRAIPSKASCFAG